MYILFGCKNRDLIQELEHSKRKKCNVQHDPALSPVVFRYAGRLDQSPAADRQKYPIDAHADCAQCTVGVCALDSHFIRELLQRADTDISLNRSTDMAVKSY